MTKRALIVVDVQNDFCEGGALPVEGGAAVAAAITGWLHSQAARYDTIVATRDHHIDPGEHFSDDPDFVTTWPAHCVAGTPGASFHPSLDVGPIEQVFSKGAHEAAYSGFEGATPDGVGLAEYLEDQGVKAVDICGLATDHCVRATAMDAVKSGIQTDLLLDLSAGVAPETTRQALAELHDLDVTIRTNGTP